jgi:hypothetical protein
MKARRRSARLGVVLAAALPVVLLAIAVHASTRRSARAREQPAIERVATRLASSDLALSGGARWLRSPSLEEPGAAFADGPALPDPDPAGGVMSPPRAVWASERRGGK